MLFQISAVSSTRHDNAKSTGIGFEIIILLIKKFSLLRYIEILRGDSIFDKISATYQNWIHIKESNSLLSPQRAPLELVTSRNFRCLCGYFLRLSFKKYSLFLKISFLLIQKNSINILLFRLVRYSQAQHHFPRIFSKNYMK